MSRIGRSPITVPSAVKINLDSDGITVEGPKGKVSHRSIEGITVTFDDGVISVERADDSKDLRSKHGLVRSLVANAVQGVSEGYQKSLEIVGVGYRAEMQGKSLNLSLGYSHPVVFKVPDGIEIEVEKNGINVRGADKQQVGQVAAEIRGLRPPDAYKGKGVRYAGEQLRLKVGKAGAA